MQRDIPLQVSPQLAASLDRMFPSRRAAQATRTAQAVGQALSINVPEYLARTAHLTTAEHGAFILLALHRVENGGLPDDDGQLARITRLAPQQWEKSKPVITKLIGKERRA
jgi:Protein of unknown function (DUF1376)